MGIGIARAEARGRQSASSARPTKILPSPIKAWARWQGFDPAPARVHIRRCPAGRVWSIFRHTLTACGRGRGLERKTGVGQLPFGRRQGRCGIGHKQICALAHAQAADPISVSTLSGSTDIAHASQLSGRLESRSNSRLVGGQDFEAALEAGPGSARLGWRRPNSSHLAAAMRVQLIEA